MMRKLLVLLLCGLFLFAMPPQDEAYSDSRVAQIQRSLTELGYNPGPVDGAWGSRTERAVRQFLRDNSRPISYVFRDYGVDYNRLLTSLEIRSNSGNGRAGALQDTADGRLRTPSAQQTERVEKLLVALGYFDQVPNGVWDDATNAAVKQFVAESSRNIVWRQGQRVRVQVLLNELRRGSHGRDSVTQVTVWDDSRFTDITDAKVRRIEKLLDKLGYLTEKPDGHWTDETFAAALLFARGRSLDEAAWHSGGRINPDALISELERGEYDGHRASSFPAIYRSDVRSGGAPSIQEVREIQILLATLGYDPGARDGVWTIDTRLATEQFALDRSLEADTWRSGGRINALALQVHLKLARRQGHSGRSRHEHETETQAAVSGAARFTDITIAQVRKIELLLDSLGYLIAWLDGHWSDETFVAAQWFARDRSLDDTAWRPEGRIDPDALIEELGRAAAAGHHVQWAAIATSEEWEWGPGLRWAVNREVQTLLRDIDYPFFAVNNDTWSVGMTIAVLRLANQNDLNFDDLSPAPGQIDGDALIEALTAAKQERIEAQTAQAQTGGAETAPDRTMQVEQLLSDLGYEVGPVDGDWEAQALSAARVFAHDRGLEDALWKPNGAVNFTVLTVHLELAKRAGQRAVDSHTAGEANPGGRTHGGNAAIVPQFGHSAWVSSLALSHDGRMLASGGADNAVILWDIETGEVLNVLKKHSETVLSVAISPDGSLVASGGNDHTVLVWNTSTGEIVQRVGGFRDAVEALWFHDDGRSLMMAETINVGTSDLATGNRRVMSGGLGTGLSPDRSLMIQAIDRRRGLRIADATTGETVSQFTLPGELAYENNAGSVGWSPDNDRVAVIAGTAQNISDAKYLMVFEVATGKELSRTEYAGDVFYPRNQRLTFFADGNRLLVRTFEEAQIWDTRNGEVLNTFAHEGSHVTSARLAENDEQVVTGGADGSILLWDVATGRQVRAFGGEVPAITSVAVSPDRQRIATGGSDGTVRVWDRLSGEQISTIDAHAGLLDTVLYTPDGSVLVTVGHDKRVRGWDAESGARRFELAGHDAEINVAAMSESGDFLLSGDSQGTAILWNIRTGEMLRRWRAQQKLIHEAAVSPDGDVLVTCGHDGTCKVWNPEATAPVQELPLDQNAEIPQAVEWMSFAPGGARLITVVNHPYRYAVQMWDTADWREIWRSSIEKKMGGWKADVGAFSQDGSLIAISEIDKIVLIAARDGNVVARLHGHTNDVTSGQFIAGSDLFVSGGADGTLRLWSLGGMRELASMRGLADDEWITTLPSGFFSSSSGASRNMAVRSGEDVYSIEQFYQTLYRPDLVRSAFADDPDGEVAAAAHELSLDAVIGGGGPPAIEIIAPEPSQRAGAESIDMSIKVTDRGGGVGRVEWKINGTTIGVGERGLARIEGETGGAERTLELSRTLLLEPGENVIEVVAYNAANHIASEPVTLSLQWDGVSGSGPPDLHIMAVGVNDYWDSQLRLNYAVPDARALAEAFGEAGPGLYDEIHVHTVFDEDVTVGGLERAFSALANEVRPQDVFVFFIAGHGKTVDGRYYFLPQDFRFRNEDSILTDGIGQDRWQDWFARIQARKSVLLYDTCESGSLTGDRIAQRGIGRLTAMDKLTRAMGRTVLSAATDDAPALEGYRGHGVFTYALLEALGQADVNGNDRIEVTELATHVDERVPIISHQAFGIRQVPQMRIVGSNFPIGVQLASLSTGDEPAPEIPTTPTHVVVSQTPVRAAADEGADAVGELQTGHQVAVIEESGGWARVARDGRVVGYLPLSVLIRLQ